MAFYPELKGPSLEAYKNMVNVLRTRAMKELNLAAEDVVIRPLRFEDIGGANPEWTFNCTAADAWNTVVDTTIDDNRFVGICGVYHNEALTDIHQIKITRKGTTARFWDVIDIRNWQHKTGWSDEPVTIDQNTKLTIEFWVTAASTLTDFKFIGAVAEKRGILISP